MMKKNALKKVKGGATAIEFGLLAALIGVGIFSMYNNN